MPMTAYFRLGTAVSRNNTVRFCTVSRGLIYNSATVAGQFLLRAILVQIAMFLDC